MEVRDLVPNHKFFDAPDKFKDVKHQEMGEHG